MTAPLPIRFYNPVKGLCQKANLDYDTVIASTLTNKTIIEAFINSELKKPLEEQRFEDRQNLKKQKEFFVKKYGDRLDTEAESGSGAVLPDDSKVDQPAALQNSEGDTTRFSDGFNKDGIKYLRPKGVWIPGRPL
jgi:hypothetical protein